jgi:hypothetical protein
MYAKGMDLKMRLVVQGHLTDTPFDRLTLLDIGLMLLLEVLAQIAGSAEGISPVVQERQE